MKKIPTLYERNPVTHLVNEDKITYGCEWVFDKNTSVIPLKKLDGTACIIINNRLYKRYDCKKGTRIPMGFIPSQEPIYNDDDDGTFKHFPGWIECEKTQENKYHFEGLLNLRLSVYEMYNYYNVFHVLDGTYELIGEKINKNPENVKGHTLIKHESKSLIIKDILITQAGIKEYIRTHDIEGIVFYKTIVDSVGGTMCKIKGTDFGFKRGEF